MIGLLLSVVLAQGYYTPAEAQAVFGQANDAYYREDYPAAIETYQKLLERGFGGEDLLYNLGTAYLAQDDLGRAVLSLERARRLGGEIEDIDAQLAVARSRQLDQVVGALAEETFVARVTAATHADAAGWTFLGAWTVGFLSLLAFRLLPAGKRGWTVVTLLSAVALVLPAGPILAAHVYEARAVREAVIVAPTVQARELPKPGGKVAFEIHAGLKVRTFESSGAFSRIRLPNGLEGWVQQDTLEAL
ncbi:MAG: SH3 domain-containing protein [Myxococcota bacterium]|nr:SH3 domain-containing protein [Myxococcota bacterium]